MCKQVLIKVKPDLDNIFSPPKITKSLLLPRVVEPYFGICNKKNYIYYSLLQNLLHPKTRSETTLHYYYYYIIIIINMICNRL